MGLDRVTYSLSLEQLAQIDEGFEILRRPKHPLHVGFNELVAAGMLLVGMHHIRIDSAVSGPREVLDRSHRRKRLEPELAHESGNAL